MSCTFDPCDKPVRSRQLCAGHYQQQRVGKELTPLQWRGKHNKPYEPIHGRAGTYTNHKCRCDPCREAWNAECARRKQARVGLDLPEGKEHGQEPSYQWGCRCPACTKAHTEHATEKRYMMKNGRVAALRKSQGGLCACCGEERTLVVDHIHGTSHVRGLLCHACNTGIGKLGDDIEGLERALAYLRDSTPAFLA